MKPVVLTCVNDPPLMALEDIRRIFAFFAPEKDFEMSGLRQIIATAFVGTCLAAPASAQERTMIVFDGSGSMWGQIEGRAKIEIAREVLGDVLGQLPAENALGLMAYGHRRKGDCADIELAVPTAPGAAPAIATFVNTIKPKGKTPLSEAVKQAAEALRYTEDKATVILITDGVETCNADPCALARQLEDSGVDFTTHVVGFGLSDAEGAQVSCLAEATGGTYLQAENADALTKALTQTVVAQPEPDPIPDPQPALPAFNLRLTASLAPGGPLLEDPDAKWSLTHRDTGARERFTGSTQEVTLPEGAYDVNLGLGGWNFTDQAKVVKTDTGTLHLDLNMGVLTVNVVEGIARTLVGGRLRADSTDASGSDFGGGYASGKRFYFPAGKVRLSAQKGSYIHIDKTVDLAAGETREEELQLIFGTVAPTVHWTKGGAPVTDRVMVKLYDATTDEFVGQVVAGTEVAIGAGKFVARGSLGSVSGEAAFDLSADDQRASPVLVLNAAPVEFGVTMGDSVKRWAVLDSNGAVLSSSSREQAKDTLGAGAYQIELRMVDGSKKHIPFDVVAGVPMTVNAAP